MIWFCKSSGMGSNTENNLLLVLRTTCLGLSNRNNWKFPSGFCCSCLLFFLIRHLPVGKLSKLFRWGRQSDDCQHNSLACALFLTQKSWQETVVVAWIYSLILKDFGSGWWAWICQDPNLTDVYHYKRLQHWRAVDELPAWCTGEWIRCRFDILPCKQWLQAPCTSFRASLRFNVK